MAKTNNRFKAEISYAKKEEAEKACKVFCKAFNGIIVFKTKGKKGVLCVVAQAKNPLTRWVESKTGMQWAQDKKKLISEPLIWDESQEEMAQETSYPMNKEEATNKALQIKHILNLKKEQVSTRLSTSTPNHFEIVLQLDEIVKTSEIQLACNNLKRKPPFNEQAIWTSIDIQPCEDKTYQITASINNQPSSKIFSATALDIKNWAIAEKQFISEENSKRKQAYLKYFSENMHLFLPKEFMENKDKIIAILSYLKDGTIVISYRMTDASAPQMEHIVTREEMERVYGQKQ